MGMTIWMSGMECGKSKKKGQRNRERQKGQQHVHLQLRENTTGLGQHQLGFSTLLILSNGIGQLTSLLAPAHNTSIQKCDVP